MPKHVILTGLRANSEFHLGNYLGGILPMVELQKQYAGEYQINMFIPDLHSFTTPIDHGKLYQQSIDNLRMFVAAGLDMAQPDTYLYRQSAIAAHSELTWILSCFTGFGELARMTQFKDKSQTQGQDASTAGLFTYPVLMAADMLLYGAEWIPVGEDQRQHIELTRDLALRLNHKFERDLFIVPHEWQKQLAFAQRDNGVRIRSLRNPAKKMSKSVDDPAGTIILSDAPAAAHKKVMSATTDSVGAIHLDWETQPGISNLLQIEALLSDRPLAAVAAEWDGQTSYGSLKTTVADRVAQFMTDLQKRYANVDTQNVLQTLERDEAAMKKVADQTLYNVQQAVGLRA